MRQRAFVVIVGLALTSVFVAQAGDAWARARFGGSRGSRSFSAPARPSAPSPASPASPAAPSRSAVSPAPAPAAPAVPRPSFLGSMAGAFAGFALGGLLGNLLFGAGRGFGLGLFDMLPVGGALTLLYQFMKRREAAPAHAGAGSARAPRTNTGAGGTAVLEMPSGAAGSHGDLARGIDHIRQMDAAFDPVALAEWARAQYGNVQSAVMMRDMGIVRDRLAPQMYADLQRQAEELKARKRTNYVEKIAIERSEVTEAWQESGQDFATVYFAGSMVDYTLDDASGELVEGSREVAPFEEFWTFTRPVGPSKWKLAAIQSP
jgi:predicted lipid-binding transport protein (Tim44 family)